MQLIVPFCFLCLLILQQTITVTSFTAMMRTPDNEARRLYSARRLRAPLMGRSITTTLHTDDDDDSDLSKSDSNGSSNSNENELITLDKRRSYAVLGGRRWVNSRKRGPLFG